MNNLLFAQDFFRNPDGEFFSGFNSRILGEIYTEACQYPNPERCAGWWKADEMIRSGKCFFVQRFPHPPCTGYAFPYGGTWVCNDCGANHLDKPWWTIRVQKDGNSFCCYGLDFVDLQESSNYAFGATFEEAIANYGNQGPYPRMSNIPGVTLDNYTKIVNEEQRIIAQG
jgi:hypothetical protein